MEVFLMLKYRSSSGTAWPIPGISVVWGVDVWGIAIWQYFIFYDFFNYLMTFCFCLFHYWEEPGKGPRIPSGAGSGTNFFFSVPSGGECWFSLDSSTPTRSIEALRATSNLLMRHSQPDAGHHTFGDKSVMVHSGTSSCASWPRLLFCFCVSNFGAECLRTSGFLGNGCAIPVLTVCFLGDGPSAASPDVWSSTIGSSGDAVLGWCPDGLLSHLFASCPFGHSWNEAPGSCWGIRAAGFQCQRSMPNHLVLLETFIPEHFAKVDHTVSVIFHTRLMTRPGSLSFY